MTISVAWFDHMRDNIPQMVVTTWDSFATKLEDMAQTERDFTQKERSPLVSPAIYNVGDRRQNVNVQGFGGWFAIDIDDAGCTLQEASDLCSTARISHVIWTTTNHKNDAHRFRVAFPLSRYVARDEMTQLWAGVHAFFKEWGDVRTKDPARMMIGPAQWQATDAQFIRVDDFGQMDVAHVLAMAPVPTSIAVSARPKHRAPATHSSVVSVERKKAQLALDNWNQGTLTHEHLRGVKAEHLLPAAIQVSNHRRYGSKLTAAKKALVKMQQAAK